MKDFFRNNGLLILIIAVLLTLIVAITSALMGGIADPLSNLAGIVTTPFRNGANRVVTWMEEQYQGIFRRDELQAEYEALKKKYAELEALQKRIHDRIKAILGIEIRVSLVEPKSLERFTGKAQRVVDLRQK